MPGTVCVNVALGVQVIGAVRLGVEKMLYCWPGTPPVMFKPIYRFADTQTGVTLSSARAPFRLPSGFDTSTEYQSALLVLKLKRAFAPANLPSRQSSRPRQPMDLPCVISRAFYLLTVGIPTP